MTTVFRAPPTVLQFFSNSGTPLIGGTLLTQVGGVNATTYQDAAGTIPLPNPIPLNSRGEVSNAAGQSCELFLPSGSSYTFTLFDAAGNQIGQYPNITGIGDISSLSSGTGAAQVGYTEGGTGAVTRSVAAKLQETISVLDFGADPTGTNDSTAAIQNAINALPNGGRVLLPPGTFKISTTLNILTPVMLIGSGMGSAYIPVSAPVTQLSWAGGAASMITLGANGSGSSIVGGGVLDLELTGNNLAATGITLKDVQYPQVRRVNMSGMTTQGVLLTNSSGQITGFGEFEDVYLQFLTATSVGVNGFVISGVSSSADGTTLFMMRNCRVDHQNGSGVLVGSVGDAFVWERLFTYRSNSSTGFGVNFAGTTGGVCGGHVFIKPVVTGGFYFLTPLLNNGTRILSANLFDVNTGVVYASGPGVGDVQVESDLGFVWGRGLLDNQHVSYRNDPMKLVYWSSANNYAATGAGNWITSTSGGNIASAGVPGGAVSLLTSNANGNAVGMQGCLPADGFSLTGSFAALDVIIFAVTFTNIRIRFGFADSLTDPPSNGVYVQFDSSVSAYYQLVCVSGGTATTVTTNIGPSNAKEEFYIFVQPGSVVFQHRNPGAVPMTLLGTITTNIPTASMADFYYAKTLTTAVARLDVYSHKLGFPDEV